MKLAEIKNTSTPLSSFSEGKLIKDQKLYIGAQKHEQSFTPNSWGKRKRMFRNKKPAKLITFDIKLEDLDQSLKQVLISKLSHKNKIIIKVLLLVLIPVSFISFINYKIYLAGKYHDIYTISFTKENFKNLRNRLFINEDPSSPKFNKNIKSANSTEVLSSPLSFVWRPEEFPLGKTVTVGAKIEDKGDWDISILCPNCRPEEKYKWKPFYRGKLEGYHLITGFNGINIYSRNKIENSQNANSVEEWMKKNIKDGTSVEILDNSFPKREFVNGNVGFKEGSYITINKTLRGPHTFYVYLKDKFELEIEKEDLNWYEGDDKVTVTLSDTDGNIVYKDLIEDEDDKAEDKQRITKKKFEYNSIYNAGVYKLSFQGNNDWIINKLKLNTNKIVFTGDSFILDPVDLYTNLSSSRDLKVAVWHESSLQKVQINDSKNKSYDMDITINKVGKEQFVSLAPDSYSIKAQGNQVIGGAELALSSESFFNPFTYSFTTRKDEAPEIVISNVNYSSESSTSSANFSPQELSKLSDLNNIEFITQNMSLAKNYKKGEDLANHGYKGIYKNNSISVYAKINKNTESLKPEPNTSIDTFVEKTIPGGKLVYVEPSIPIDKSKLYTSSLPADYASTYQPIFDYNIKLKGAHTFYILGNAKFASDITIKKLSGEGSVQAILKDIAGNEICKTNFNPIAKNSKTLTAKLRSDLPYIGVYQLEVKPELKNTSKGSIDFSINNIVLNANKLVAKGMLNVSKPLKVFTKFNIDSRLYIKQQAQKLNLVVSTEGKGNEVIAVNMNEKNPFDIFLPPGSHFLDIPANDIQISGANFSFSKESWFDIYSKTLVSNALIDTDYKIVESYPANPIFSELSLEIKK